MSSLRRGGIAIGVGVSFFYSLFLGIKTNNGSGSPEVMERVKRTLMNFLNDEHKKLSVQTTLACHFSASCD